ncbi:MAG TPA: hypothetical protein VIE40_02000 [Dehalococcoidia bacterium]
MTAEVSDAGEGAGGCYSEADVKLLFRRGVWQAWHEASNWLARYGEAEPEMTADAARCLIADIDQLIRRHVPITQNAHDAYRLLRQHTVGAATARTVPSA